MSDNQKKSQRLDKNGRPYPENRDSSTQKKKSKSGGKSAKARPPKQSGASHPMDWFFLHREPYTVDQLKEDFASVPDLDIEVWPGLQVMELTFPSKVYIDFEYTDDPPQEEDLMDLLKREQIQTVYYVTVEPFCSDAELEFLQDAARKTGGLIVADNDQLLPLFR